MTGRSRTTIRAFGTVFLLPLLALAACNDDSPTEPRNPEHWRAELVGTDGYDEIEGQVSVESTSSRIEIEIVLSGIEADVEYTWEIAGGTCEDPGDPLGDEDDFPGLTGDEDGSATANATVGVGLVSGEDYHTSVRIAESPETIIACGDVVLED